ncbi:MAG: hypothetical protein PUB19_00470 [Lachnospiraceae bacterium]|nr:hypothetical protein [Lachnospiraceae bacterium]
MKELLEKLKAKRDYYCKIEQLAEQSLSKNKREGYLQVSRSNGVIQYYVRGKEEKGKGTYLPKSQRSIAEEIAQRDYDRQVMKCANQWQRWAKRTIQTMPQIQLADIYDKSQGRKPLITPYEISNNDYIAQWEAVPYQGKPFASDSPEIYTERGERVRSKSEKMIADKLYMLEIPYRYEYRVYLKNFGTIYPDFLLLNKFTREEVILEHFGMMDNPDYAEKAIRKMNQYARNGFVLGKNFLATFETTDTPMDLRVLEKMVTDLI